MKNPKLYRELSEPFASPEAANDAINAFLEDLGAIREKHRILNVLCVVSGTMIERGEETEYMTSLSYGDSLRRPLMAAWAYGSEKSDADTIMRRIIADAGKSTEARVR